MSFSILEIKKEEANNENIKKLLNKEHTRNFSYRLFYINKI